MVCKENIASAVFFFVAAHCLIVLSNKENNKMVVKGPLSAHCLETRFSSAAPPTVKIASDVLLRSYASYLSHCQVVRLNT